MTTAGRSRSGAVGRRVAGVLVASLVAVALAISPPAVQPALAASTLRIQADAIYTLEPDAGRVKVEIAFKVTNLKPNSASFVYFYRELGFPLQPEASTVRVSGGAGSIATEKRDGYTEAVVRLRANLYYRDTTTFTIRYELLGAEPRSDEPIRVGAAFATFGVWAWGDAGRSTVEVRTPPGFVTQVDGGPLDLATRPGGQVLSAVPQDPETFFAIVNAENRSAYEQTRISFDGGVEIVVLAWPEDDAWDETVSDILRRGIPELRALIGLPWPVAHDLNVRERYTRALEGYAGVFFVDDQRIDVSEDLDPVTIMHEATHAWFNDELIEERWIYEGLAEEYAWQALRAIGVDPGPGPERPDLDDPGHLVLVGWRFPQVIRDQTTDDRERYGYGAAFYVIHELVEAAGPERMRDAFAAIDASLTAYVGAGPRETVDLANDWRRLLDLAQPIDQPDSASLEEVLRTFAISEIDGRGLTNRKPAREQYRALVEAGDGWLPPWFVRKRMGEWGFVGAVKAMEQATAVLALRDKVTAAAGALGLEPDGALRAAYEGAQDGFDGATAIANDQLAALARLADAKAKVDAAPDFLTQLGLIGATPGVPYEAARAAFEAGNLEEAVTSAADVITIIEGAPAIGQQRLLLAVGSTAALLLVLFGCFLLLRRRGRRRRALALALATAAPADPDPTVPAPTEAYATLAADPAEAPPPPSAGPPGDEGGDVRGDSPAEP